jgi:hypothetical protein
MADTEVALGVTRSELATWLLCAALTAAAIVWLWSKLGGRAVRVELTKGFVGQDEYRAEMTGVHKRLDRMESLTEERIVRLHVKVDDLSRQVSRLPVDIAFQLRGCPVEDSPETPGHERRGE